MASYAHFILDFERKFSPEEQAGHFENTLIDEITGTNFGGWINHVSDWTKCAPRTVLIKYEDLVAEPEKQMAYAMHELGTFPTRKTRLYQGLTNCTKMLLRFSLKVSREPGEQKCLRTCMTYSGSITVA
jgi:hypothetical protein